MKKDLKIGMFIGLCLVIAAGLWLATRPQISVRSRMIQQQTLTSLPESPTEIEPTNQIPITPKNEEVIAVIVDEPEPVKIKTQRFHIVQKGQTLSEIAQKYYGSAGQWPKILKANRNTIKNEKDIKPGMKLIIPD